MTTTHMSYTPTYYIVENKSQNFEVIASWRDFCEIFEKKKKQESKIAKLHTSHLFSLVRFTHPCNIYASQWI